jgi:hypothetical protein
MVLDLRDRSVEPHTKWIDLSNQALVNWGIKYLNKLGVGYADESTLKLLKFSKSRQRRIDLFGSTGRFLEVRRNMENAWRVYCSRQKNSHMNPRYVAISNVSKEILKDLGKKDGMSESGALNYLIKNTDAYVKGIKAEASRNLDSLMDQCQKKVARARDRSQTIERKKSIAKQLVIQREQIHQLQILFEGLSPSETNIASILEVFRKLEECNVKIQEYLDPKCEL